jgi:iron complex transport system ATP-binding protein
VTFGYRPGRPIFSGLDLQIHSGRFVGIIGPNGSGKTTLIRLLTGLARPQSGQVLLMDRPIQAYPPRALAAHLAVVPQGPVAPPGFSVIETVLMARFGLSGMRVFLGKSDRQIAWEALRAAGVEDLGDRPLDQLSGGELQLVFLARAFAQQSKVIILDEPTTYLDMYHQIRTYGLLKRSQTQHGKTVVVVTHDLNLAAWYCDMLIMLQSGQPIVGAPDQVLTSQKIAEVFGVPTVCGYVGGQRVFVHTPGARTGDYP